MNFKIVVSEKLHCGSPAFLGLFNSTSAYVITTHASSTEPTRLPGWSPWQQILNEVAHPNTLPRASSWKVLFIYLVS